MVPSPTLTGCHVYETCHISSHLHRVNFTHFRILERLPDPRDKQPLLRIMHWLGAD